MQGAQNEPSTLDAPWLRRQVEPHLIFGFLAKRLLFAWVLVSGLVLAVTLALSRGSLVRALELAIVIPFCLLYFRMSKYRQAALGWWIIKVTAALCSFLLFIAGGLVGFFRAQPDAIYITTLALVSFPGPEFVPSIVENQRFITLLRLTVSVPIIYFGSQTGNWTWR